MEIRQTGKSMAKVRKFLLGIGENDGFIFKTVVYLLLIGIGFIYLYPVLFMISNSFMSTDDLVNAMVKWVPTALYFDNYVRAMKVLDFWDNLLETLKVVGIPAIIQTLSTAIIGYGFARFDFPMKKLLFVLMLTTFIIPPQITSLSTYLMFKDYDLLGSLQTLIYPAALGQGLRSSLFILIFYQFFKKIPVVLEEAAQLDGAGFMKIFYRLAVPMAGPAIIIVFLFSFVWYWNETVLTGLYIGKKLTTLQLELEKFTKSYEDLFPKGTQGNQLNEAIRMAGTMLVTVPLLMIYFALQRWFVEGVDRTGITGE